MRRLETKWGGCGMSEWIQTSIGNVVKINANSIDKNYHHQNIYYLDTSSLTRNHISGYLHMKLSDAPTRARRLVECGDVLYSTVRPNQRHYGFISSPPPFNLVVSTGFAVIHPDNSRIIPHYLYYWLTQDCIVDRLSSIAELAVTAYPSISPDDIKSLKICYPADVCEQQSIADVLSCLDSKIEINRKLNHNLALLAA